MFGRERKGSTENAVVRYQSRYQRYCSKIKFVVGTAFSVYFRKVPHFPRIKQVAVQTSNCTYIIQIGFGCACSPLGQG